MTETQCFNWFIIINLLFGLMTSTALDVVVSVFSCKYSYQE